MLLTEFAGNAELKYELGENMKRGTLPHAVIIEGAAGTGKRTLADIIARGFDKEYQVGGIYKAE